MRDSVHVRRLRGVVQKVLRRVRDEHLHLLFTGDEHDDDDEDEAEAEAEADD